MKKFQEFVVVAGIYFAVTILFFYPVLPHFSTSLIGPPEDNMLLFWYLWHGTHAIFNHLPFMHTQLIYFPSGIGLFYTSYYYFGILLALPIASFLTLPAIYNFLTLHSFVLGGVAMFYLIRTIFETEGERGYFWPSLIGGFIFAFNPAHYSKSLHHIHLGTIYFVPLFILFFLKSLREGKTKHILLSILFFVIGSLCDWGYLIYLLVFVFMSYVYLAYKNKKVVLWKEIRVMTAIVGGGILLLSPLIVPMIKIGLGGKFKIVYEGHDIYVADLLGYVIPHTYHALGNWEWIQKANALMTGTEWEKAVYLGIANLVLLGVAFRETFQKQRKYWMGLIAFLILALGVRPHVLGQALPIPLPYELIRMAPFLTNARNPDRILVFGYVFLSILAAFSIQHLFFKPNGTWSVRRRVVFVTAALLIFLDFYSINTVRTPVVLPPAYAEIREDKARDFGILELPADYGRYQMYQTIHGIPIVQGYVNRRFETVLSDTLEFDPRNLPRQREQLIKNKVKYIVLHKRRLTFDPQKEADQKWEFAMNRVAEIYSRFYEKIYEDEDAASFRVY